MPRKSTTERTVTYKGHEITGPDDMLGYYHAHGPDLHCGAPTLAGAKRMVDRHLLQASCAHPKTRVEQPANGKPRTVCEACDKFLGFAEAR